MGIQIMSIQKNSLKQELSYIDSIYFSVYSNNDVKDASSVYKDEFGINIPESYDGGEPKTGGLVDDRLGVTDSNLFCGHCGLNSIECPGHFGHIELADPVFHMGYIQIVKNILSCICLRSSKLLTYKNEKAIAEIIKNKKGKHRFAEIKKICQNVTISNTGIPVPKIKQETKKNTAVIQMIAEYNLLNTSNQQENPEFEGRKKIREILTPSDVYNILKNISNEDWKTLGFDAEVNRPEDFIIKNYPVPPVAIRPSIKADFLAAQNYEDTLTHKLADIVKCNIRIRKQKEKDKDLGEISKYGADNLNLLQYHAANLC